MKIKVKNLTKTFLQKTDYQINAIKNISFEIKSGDFIALKGPSGAGKSTLAALLTGIEKPSSGSILYEEIEGVGSILVDENTKMKKMKIIPSKIAMTFQMSNLQIFKTTVFKDVSFALQAKGMPYDEVEKKAIYFLEKLNIKKELWDRSPFQLSEGQKRKVILAAILISEPKMIIFDEPTANLDTSSRRNFLETIREINSQGITILMISHDIRAINRYAKKIMTLREGKLVSFENNSKRGNYE